MSIVINIQNTTIFEDFEPLILTGFLKGCRTLVQTGTAAEPSDASDQIRTDALCAHPSRRFRPEPKWILASVPLALAAEWRHA